MTHLIPRNQLASTTTRTANLPEATITCALVHPIDVRWSRTDIDWP